jgi:hypothetical protein
MHANVKLHAWVHGRHRVAPSLHASWNHPSVSPPTWRYWNTALRSSLTSKGRVARSSGPSPRAEALQVGAAPGPLAPGASPPPASSVLACSGRLHASTSDSSLLEER